MHARLMGPTAMAAAALVLVGCDDPENPVGPSDEPAAREVMLDATADFAFLSLGEGEVSVTDAASSGDWDLAFFGTSSMVNGGDAGPAGVRAYCLCANADASDGEVIGMTPEAALDDFETVSAADAPTDPDAWVEDELAPVINGWFDYDMESHTVSANPDAAWKLRGRDGDAPVFARFRMVKLKGASRSDAGQVTFEVATQPAGEEIGETETFTVDLSNGAIAFFDLGSGDVGSEADWDLRMEGFTIRLNGGVSGDGRAGAIATGEPFEEIDDPASEHPRAFRQDAFSGVFAQNPWYRYNLEGNHQIWPLYDVYLVQRGDALHKVQLIGYYNEAGDARHITVRHAPLEG